MSLVRCDNLSIHFGDRAILSDADFSIEPNERVCLIGRNGAGKSTLLKIIAGEVQPDGGARLSALGIVAASVSPLESGGVYAVSGIGRH